MRWFRRERDAYAHLLHYGICAKGIVPYCYGYVPISRKHISRMIKVCAPGKFDHNVADMKYDLEPPRALLLEYFEDAQPVSFRNATIDIADTALRHLHAIHTAYILHGDINGRNILLLPDGRVVWTDFDSALTLSLRRRVHRHEPPRATFVDELSLCWSLFYNSYVSRFYLLKRSRSTRMSS